MCIISERDSEASHAEQNTPVSQEPEASSGKITSMLLTKNWHVRKMKFQINQNRYFLSSFDSTIIVELKQKHFF